MKTFSLSLLLSFALSFLMTAQAQNAPPRHIAVTGEGIVRVDPDKATVRIAVVTRADNPEEAHSQNEQAAAEVLRRIKALGIATEDIQLEVLTLHPIQEWDEERRTTVERGYEATRQVRVELDDLSKLPELISGTVAEGANRLLGIEYGLDDRDEATHLAIERAARNAQEKARRAAIALGTALGSVYTAEVQDVGMTPPPMYRMEAMAADGSAGNPEAYAAGQIEVRVHLRVAFLLQ